MSAPISADDRLYDLDNGIVTPNHFPVVAIKSGLQLQIFKVYLPRAAKPQAPSPLVLKWPDIKRASWPAGPPPTHYHSTPPLSLSLPRRARTF